MPSTLTAVDPLYAAITQAEARALAAFGEASIESLELPYGIANAVMVAQRPNGTYLYEPRPGWRPLVMGWPMRFTIGAKGAFLAADGHWLEFEVPREEPWPVKPQAKTGGWKWRGRTIQ